MYEYDEMKLGLSVAVATLLGHLPARVISPGRLGLVAPAQMTTALDHAPPPFFLPDPEKGASSLGCPGTPLCGDLVGGQVKGPRCLTV